MPNEELTVTPESPVDRTIEIVPFGTDETIKLNVAIVQKMIAIPTKQGKLPDATQCIRFMMLCKARHLNPFEGDAFLIGYDTNAGPQFSLITAHQVFLKRAEASQGFNGMQSGVVVLSYDTVLEREGDLTYDGETLLGGWAKVYLKDMEFPFYRRIKLSTFNTGRSRWEKDPAGMIVKCAEADALRSAFPTHLGGLYLREELPAYNITPDKVAPPEIEFGPAVPEEKVRRKRRTKAEMEAASTPEPEPVSTSGLSHITGLSLLRDLLTSNDVNETAFQRFLIISGYIEPSDTLDKLSPEKLSEITTAFVEITNEMQAA